MHANLAAAWQAIRPERVYAFTTKATTRNTDIAYRKGDVLLFGPEPTGLPEEVLADSASPISCGFRCCPGGGR